MKQLILKYLLIIFSAVLYGMAFIKAAYCWWFIFIFLMPLSYWFSLGRQVSFADGLFWGLMSNGIIFWGLLIFFNDHAKGGGYGFVWFFFIGYLALYAGLWFYALHRFHCNELSGLISFLVPTWLYFVSMYTVSFKIFDYRLLNLFSFPLIVFPANPIGIILLKNSFHPLFLLGLLIGHARIWFIAKKSYRYAYASVVFLVFMTGCFYGCSRNPIADDLSDRMAFFLIEKQSKTDIEQQMGNFLNVHSKKRYLIAPESTISYPIERTSRILKYLNENMHENSIFMLGAHRKEDGNLFNSLLVIQNGQITHYYDKKILMPFAEYVPRYWRWLSISKKLLLENYEEFHEGKGDAVSLKIDDNLIVTPLICSEFFFTNQASLNQTPVLCLANDSWFSCQYIKKNMALIAQYRAIIQNRIVIYVAHSRALVMGRM